MRYHPAKPNNNAAGESRDLGYCQITLIAGSPNGLLGRQTMSAEIIPFPKLLPHPIDCHRPDRREYARRLVEICKRMTHSDAEAARWATGLLKASREAANQ